MKAVRNWLVCAGVLAVCSSLWGGDDLAAVYARMDQAAPKFKGMRADMKRISHTALINIDEINTGTILVKVPKPHEYHILIDFLEPDKKTVAVSGTKAEMYLPKANEIQEYNFGKGHKGEIEQFLRLGFGSTSAELRDAYTVTYGGPETIAGQKATRIELVPKSKDLAATFPKFELWISQEPASSGISIQQKMYEASGNYTVATYSKVRLDPNIPDNALKLNTPKGTPRHPV
jgi:outer membrane lipoprotein-sorting protein